MAITFPTDPGAQSPVNTFSPSSTPVANSANGNTYVWNGTAWTTQQANLEQYVNVAGDTMTGTLTVPTVDSTTLNAGNIVLPDAGGITFGTNYGGTGTGTSKVLDDYEEGTWTPTFEPQTNSFSSITYDPVTYGFYQKVGDVVYVHGFIRTDALTLGSASGYVYLTGIPFQQAIGGGQNQSIFVSNTANWGGDHPSAMLTSGSGTRFALYYETAFTANTTTLTTADLGTGGNNNQMYFSGHYRAA